MDKMKFTQVIPRLRVLETRLLDKAKIDRMIDSNSAEEALKVLQETEYANVMSDVKRAEDYDNMEELKWFKVISSLLESIGVNVYELNNDLSSKGSILSIAQSIFDSPISRSITEIYCIDEEAVADEA